MQKFGNVTKWSPLVAGEALTFSSAVRVRLDVSTPHAANWYWSTDDGEVYFATTSGRECLEFVPDSGMALVCASDALVYSSEFESVHIPETGNPAFVRVANRRERNPELERVAALAAQNATRRMEQVMYDELNRRDAELERLRAAAEAAEREDAAHGAPAGNAGDAASGEVADPAAASEGVGDGA